MYTTSSLHVCRGGKKRELCNVGYIGSHVKYYIMVETMFGEKAAMHSIVSHHPQQPSSPLPPHSSSNDEMTKRIRSSDDEYMDVDNVDIVNDETIPWQDRALRGWGEWQIEWKDDFDSFYKTYKKAKQSQSSKRIDAATSALSDIVFEFLILCKEAGMDSSPDLEKSQVRDNWNERDTFLEWLDDLMKVKPTEKAVWKQRLNTLLQHSLFRQVQKGKSPPRQVLMGMEPVEEEQATIEAWIAPYQRSIHDALWNHIKGCYLTVNGYANMCAIIQSSGSGKSRTVDRLGMERLVIPVCLRDPRAAGFPPADPKVRAYLLESMRLKDSAGGVPSEVDVAYAQRRLDAFFIALFGKTLEVLNRLCPGGEGRGTTLARAFRDAMTKGQTFHSPNQFRTEFYEGVIGSATAMVQSNKSRSFREVFQQLSIRILDPQQSPPDGPLVIVAFDEAGVLTDFADPRTMQIPPVLGILRNRLSLLKKFSFFTLFLSTTGQISAFVSPQGLPNNSMRIIGRNAVLFPAFTGCTFDAFALKPVRDITTVATEWYMQHLGRPLWATRFKSRNLKCSQGDQLSSRPESPRSSSDLSQDTENTEGSTSVRQHAMRFAVGKLLNMGKDELGSWDVKNIHGLACLAQRLPIEFLSTSYVSQKTLVEDHMRICLRVDPEEERMVTSCSSEPILAEAAFVAMQRQQRKLDVLSSLEIPLRGYSVHKGDRGELVGCLLLLLARDDAVVERNGPGMCETMSLPLTDSGGERRLSEWNRVITVPHFIKSLFFEHHLDKDVLDALNEHFGDVHVHFNHFLKAYDQDVAASRYLIKLLARGAGLLCANNQEAFDCVIPCVKGADLEEKQARQILAQFKNRKKDRKSDDVKVLGGMHSASLMYAAERNAPVIRIFFELGNSTPLFRCRVTQERDYTAIDFYCAGMSPEYLKPVSIRKASDAWSVEKWKGLLDTTRDWQELLKPPFPSSNPQLDLYLKEMLPGVATEKEFWGFF